MSDLTPDIWRLIEQQRAEGHSLEWISILKAADAQGIPLNLEQQRSLIMRDGWRTGVFFRPNFLSTFIISYLEDSAPKTILDCWAGIGEMLPPLVKRFAPSVSIGLNNSVSEYEAVNLLHRDITVDWKLGDPLLLLDDIYTRFDVIIGCPPFGWKPISLTLPSKNNSVELHDDIGNLLVLKASLLLEPGGVSFFVVSPRFTMERGERKVYTNLERFGLFVDAALSLPSGAFTPTTQIGGLLLIIRREKPSCLFVGELTSEPNNSDVLLKNLKVRKAGKIPQLGALVEPASFRSFPTLVAEREVESLARSLGLPPTPLSEIYTEINLPKRTQEEEFSDLPNVVYLPILGRAPAVFSLANLQIKAQNYVQIVLNPDKAIAEYVANFFNTSLGQKIRESLCSGVTIRKITKSQLLEAVVYLPDLETQTEIIGIHSAITGLSTQLETLQRQLWNRPRKAKEIQKAVKSLNHDDNLEAWMESLPFPLASILWAYHADDDIKHKVEHLLLFFEALSEFTAVVMLSAYASDRDFYAQESGAWIDNDPKYKDWILAASFGHWKILGERLAKFTRTLQEDKNKRKRCLELFGKAEPEFLEMLTNKSLFTVLGEINNCRNEWKGHGGAANSQEYKRRLTLLESNLAKVRQVIMDRWDTALLLSPGSSDYSEGVFYYQARALVGTRTPFKKVAVETLTPMDKRKLYLLHENQKRPVELLPFFKLMESPRTQQNACYFYNRILGDEVRWVSYHFDSDAEVICPDDEVHSALSLLRPADNNTGELNL